MSSIRKRSSDIFKTQDVEQLRTMSLDRFATPALCELCKGFTYEKLKFPGTMRKSNLGSRWISNEDHGYGHHQNLEALISSALQGCGLCRMFSIAFYEDVVKYRNQEGTTWLPDSQYRIKVLYSAIPTQLPGLILDLRRGAGINRACHFGLSVRPDACNSLRDVIPGREIEPSPISYEGLQKVRHWLKSCLFDHTGCSNNDCVELPTRLIDVRGLDPKLISSNGLRGRYVALSHCWGKVMSFTTTKDTLSERTRGIDFSHLPQTFQDAILVTRKLDIPYLWIDAVCIIQNDADDWERESAKMLDVYRNSFLTIAAMSARDGNEGFLRRNAPARVCHEIPFSCSGRQIQGPVTVCWPAPDIGSDVLATRGWTLQELILPSRILHFSAEQMVWDCERREREDGLSPTNTGHLGSRIRTQLRTDKTLSASPYSQWYALVENYTSRDITVKTDKLPAISGLAQQTQRLTNDEYVAGLWKEDIVAGLMWTPSENKRLEVQGSPYRGPSWSWSAVDGSVSYSAVLHKRGQEFDLDVKEVVAVPHGRNRFGAVVNGYIKVSCSLKETVVGTKNVFGLYEIENYIGEYLPDDGEAVPGTTIWCMKTLSKPYMGDSTLQMYPHGLILSQTGELSRNEFRRIGTFKLTPGWDWFADCSKTVLTIV